MYLEPFNIPGTSRETLNILNDFFIAILSVCFIFCFYKVLFLSLFIHTEFIQRISKANCQNVGW